MSAQLSDFIFTQWNLFLSWRVKTSAKNGDKTQRQGFLPARTKSKDFAYHHINSQTILLAAEIEKTSPRSRGAVYRPLRFRILWVQVHWSWLTEYLVLGSIFILTLQEARVWGDWQASAELLMHWMIVIVSQPAWEWESEKINRVLCEIHGPWALDIGPYTHL